MNPNKLKKWKWIGLGLVVYTVNKCFLPYCDMSLFSSQNITDPKFQTCMNTEKYIHNYSCNTAQEEALKQLKLSHAITMKHFDLGHPDYSSNEELLNNRIGDCSEIPRFTYSNYLFLINKIGRPELSDYVRVATGSIRGLGHAWLEIKRNGNWVPYETTIIDFPSSTKIDPPSIDKLVQTEDVLTDGNKYNRAASHQIDGNGEMDHDFEVIGIMKEPGILSLMWKKLTR